MRIVVARGGNELRQRSDPMTIEGQRRNVRIAPGAIAMAGIVAEARVRVT